MKKTDAETPAETKPADTTKAAPPPVADPSLVAVEASTPPVFDDGHEWPSSGGCWVRQADGSLKKEG